MGRIAEALKRAEQERAGRRESEARGGEPLVFNWASGDSAPAGAESNPPAAEAGPAEPAPERAAEPSSRPFIINAAPIPPAGVGARVISFHDPTSPLAERYRSIRTRLLTGNPSGSPRQYAVTSSLPREGKTVTTANLAFSLAELRHLRVAMIDLDFRQRGLTRLLGAEGRPGIAEVIRGETHLAEVCIPVVRANLHLIPAGDAQSMSSSELLTGERVRSVFREISERFHYALIDTPPANTVADIGLIAPLCHSVLIVIRMNRTPEPMVRRCVRMLQANGVPITGSILAGYCEESAGFADAQDYFQAPGQEA
ncbi:MAG: CpsD/CapB family tyrosine-protein kinase [Phycisphaerae bacterium]|jgi:capsular exopolysaccharide synthesis family protein